jgi:hypothetical protein
MRGWLGENNAKAESAAPYLSANGKSKGAPLARHPVVIAPLPTPDRAGFTNDYLHNAARHSAPEPEVARGKICNPDVHTNPMRF